MKVDEFRKLCEEQWIERLGNVVDLELTGAAITELSDDCIKHHSFGPKILGARVSAVTNMVTGTPVPVKLATDGVDKAWVEVGGYTEVLPDDPEDCEASSHFEQTTLPPWRSLVLI